MGGAVAFPGLGIYHTSKWALEGLTEALAGEVAGFGIRTTIVEPGGYGTDWSGSSAAHSRPLPQYQAFHERRESAMASIVQPPAAATSDAVLATTRLPGYCSPGRRSTPSCHWWSSGWQIGGGGRT